MGKLRFTIMFFLIVVIFVPTLTATTGHITAPAHPFYTGRTATFLANGLPSGENFSVEILGKFYTSIGGNLTISGLQPELYVFSILLPPALSANITGGTLNLTNGNQQVAFQIHPAGDQLNYLVMVSILITVSALIVVSALLFRKQGK